MPDTIIAEVLVVLRQKAAEHDAEASRIREAIASLERLSPPEDTRSPRAASAYDPRRPSVRSMVVALLDEADRDWSASEIITEYTRRENPVHGRDPANALRAALADAKKRGLIVPTGVGRYKAVKWAVPPERPEPDRGISHILGRDFPRQLEEVSS